MSHFRRLAFLVGWSLLASSVFLAGLVHAQEDGNLSDEVQGYWKRQQNTPDGPITIIKEHRGVTSTVTAYDAAKKVLYAHSSQFTIEPSGKVKVFTFFNRAIPAGPGAGQVVKEPTSFVYRVHDGKFFEVYGLLENDPNPPRVAIWEKVNSQQP